MSDRGRARSYTSAIGSNYLVKRGSGSLYAAHGFLPEGGSVRLDNATGLGAAVDFFSVASNVSMAYYGPAPSGGAPFSISFGPGVGFDDGLVIAGTSNARASIVYE